MEKNDSVNMFFRILLLILEKHFGNKMKYDLPITSSNDISFEEIEFVSSIDISGSLKGDLYLFTSKDSLEQILEIVYSMKYSTLEEDGLLQDSVNEFLNTIVANSTEQLSCATIPIELGLPIKKNTESSVRFLENLGNSMKIKVADSDFYIVFVKEN